jgi:hypothetical protein
MPCARVLYITSLSCDRRTILRYSPRRPRSQPASLPQTFPRRPHPANSVPPSLSAVVPSPPSLSKDPSHHPPAHATFRSSPIPPCAFPLVRHTTSADEPQSSWRVNPAVSWPRTVATDRNSKAIASPRALHPDPPSAQAAPHARHAKHAQGQSVRSNAVPPGREQAQRQTARKVPPGHTPNS